MKSLSVDSHKKSKWTETTILRVCLLSMIAIFVLDIATDLSSGATKTHLVVDSVLALISLVTLLALGAFNLRSRERSAVLLSNLQDTRSSLVKSEVKARDFEDAANALRRGVGEAIEKQFEEWKLSLSEKEVALFLLKGLSIREISSLRNTSERTARHQALSIYSKSGVSGRAELAAFFLEDFLAPMDEKWCALHDSNMQPSGSKPDTLSN